MIPRHEIDAAARRRPGWDTQQVEQDIVLTRLMAEVANDKYLAEALVLKGGTCLHKLWLPEPWRYSKDLDYARTEDTPMGPGLRRIARRGPTRRARRHPHTRQLRTAGVTRHIQS